MNKILLRRQEQFTNEVINNIILDGSFREFSEGDRKPIYAYPFTRDNRAHGNESRDLQCCYRINVNTGSVHTGGLYSNEADRTLVKNKKLIKKLVELTTSDYDKFDWSYENFEIIEFKRTITKLNDSL